MERICGFVVVRKPEHVKAAMLTPNMWLGDKPYRGVDRLRWADLDVAYYDGRLPSDVSPIQQQLHRDTADFSGLKLLTDYQKAEARGFSGEKSEIIAVWSPYLEDTKGTIPCDINLRYLGLD